MINFINMTDYLSNNKKILLIGSKGALGRELVSQFRELNIPFTEAHRANLSIHDSKVQLINNLNFNKKISLVINCIAMTGLDNCYKDRKNSFAINYLFPEKITQICIEHEINMLHFSTDNVFACDKFGYLNTEHDEPYPNTWYGITKYLSEKNSSPYKKTTIRLPMLFGPTNDSQLISKLVHSLAIGNSIKVSTDIFSTPTYTPDVVSWIIKKIFSGDLCKNSTVHLSGDKLISLHDFVLDISRRIKCRGAIEPSFSQEFPSLEQKPKHGGLKSIIGYENSFSYENSLSAYTQFLIKGA